MPTKKGKRGGFVVQAGILAAAGILVKIIGLLYRSPLTSIIGDEGNGYYSFAYNIYTIILLVSSYSIPSAISKVIAQRLTFKEYRNAHRIFKCAFLYVVVVGGIGSLAAYFAAPFLVPANSVGVLRVFAPTIFLSGLCGVMRGYFQAYGSMLQTSFSQIIEQILNAAVSIGAAKLLIDMAKGKDATTRAIYGATGSALGTGAGVLIALLFMLWAYWLNRPMFRKKIRNDRTEKEESYGEIFKVILSVVTPFILSTCIYNLSTSLNQTIYSRFYMEVKGAAEAQVSTLYGIYSGKAVVITNIPIAIASAMSSAMLPAVSASYARGDLKQTKVKINQAIKVTMLIAIPAAAGLCALARPVMQTLFWQKESLEQASSVLAALAVTVIFYALSTLTNAVLQGIGKVNIPVIHATVSLGIQTILLTVLLFYTDLNLYALVLATISYSLCMCLMNAIAVKKYLKMRQELFRTFFIPAVSAAIMGIFAWLVYEGANYVFTLKNTTNIYLGNVCALFLAIAAAVVLYFFFVIKLGAVTEKELRSIPKGTALIRIAKKIHLL